MAAPPIIDELSPATIGEDLFTLSLSPLNPNPRAGQGVQIDVDYAKCAPSGVVLPLEILIQAPSASGFVRRIYRRAAPASIVFVPREGGLHGVLLREVGHNRWLGKLRVIVAGTAITAQRPS